MSFPCPYCETPLRSAKLFDGRLVGTEERGARHHDDLRCREILREQVQELRARLEGTP